MDSDLEALSVLALLAIGGAVVACIVMNSIAPLIGIVAAVAVIVYACQSSG